MKSISFTQKSSVVCVFAWLLLTIMGGVILAEPAPLSLSYDDLAPIISQKNTLIKSELHLIESEKAKTGHLKRSLLPRLSASAGTIGFYNGGIDDTKIQPIGSVDAVINLSRGGQDHTEDKIRNAQVDLTQALLQKTMASELNDAQKLYWDIVFTEEMNRSIEEVLTQTKRNFEATKRRFNRGLLTQSDLLAFTIYQNKLEEDIESNHHEKKILLIKLKAILGLSDTDLVDVTLEMIPHLDDSVLTEAFSASQSIEMKEWEMHQKMEALQRQKLSQKNRPTIDIFGNYILYTETEREYADLADRGEIAAGIRAQFIFFDANQRRSDLTSATLRSSALTQEIAYKTAHMTSTLQSEQEELIHLHELIHRSEDRIMQSKKLLAAIFQDYDQGVKTSTDVLTTLQSHQDIKTSYIRQKRDYQKTKSELLNRLKKPP